MLVSIASGRVSPDALQALADAVIDDERLRLAMEIRGGGPDALRKAIELAALVLADAVSRGT